MPWPLTLTVGLSAGTILGAFIVGCFASVSLEEAERRVLSAEAEAKDQRDLADKWKRVSDPRITEQVVNLETHRERRQSGGFGY